MTHLHAGSVLRTLSRVLRLRESLLMTGFPLFGMLMALDNAQQLFCVTTFAFMAGTILLALAVYAFNSWGGVQHDHSNPRLRNHPHVTGDISPSAVLGLSLLCFTAAIVIYFTIVSVKTGIIGILIFALWTFYSHPRTLAKGIPVVCSLVHFAGGLLQFLLGYTYRHGIDETGLVATLYFALVFVAGHLNHEARDFDADLNAGIQTNAVKFGAARIRLIAFAIFLLAYFLAGTAVLLRLVEPLSAMPFVFIAVPHVYFYLRSGSSSQAHVTQAQYRLLFLGAAIAAILLKIYERQF